MARKPAKKATKKAAAEKVKAKDLIKLPNDAVIKSAATEVRNSIKRAGKINEDANKFIQGVKREKGLHPKALKDAESLRNKCLKTDKGLAAVATYVAHREHYMEVLGVNKLIEDQGQMYTRPEAGEGQTAEPTKAASADGETDVRPRNLRQPHAGTTEGNDTTLVNPNHMPSQSEVDRIADKAGATTQKPH